MAPSGKQTINNDMNLPAGSSAPADVAMRIEERGPLNIACWIKRTHLSASVFRPLLRVAPHYCHRGGALLDGDGASRRLDIGGIIDAASGGRPVSRLGRGKKKRGRLDVSDKLVPREDA